MDYCPLCGNKADVCLPNWSGGKYSIKCKGCGEFTTNKITIDELDRLRLAGSPRIKELQYSIDIANEPWYITWSQQLGIIVLESGPPQEMTKQEKKLRRKGVTVTASIKKRIVKSEDEPDKA